jgi:hypothetical protein
VAVPQAASQRLAQAAAVLQEVPARRGLREVKVAQRVKLEVRQARQVHRAKPQELKVEAERLQMAVPAAPMLLAGPEVQAERAAMGRYRRP